MNDEKSIHTIADIARLAGVSRSTVSRALNDSPLISEATRARVRAIASQHHFLVNARARQLSLQRSRTVAFVVHPIREDYSITDLFVLEMLGGIVRGLNAAGYDLLILHVDPQDTSWVHQYLDSGRVDGFILVTSAWRQRQIRALLEHDAPFIVWGAPVAGQLVCCVAGDNCRGGQLATSYLLESGRRQVAFLGGAAQEPEVRQRFAGYSTALQAAGLPIDSSLVAYSDFSPASAAAAMQRLLQRAPQLDAVFVNSDLMAITAIEMLRAQGRCVPQDVAVVGYDDLSIASLCRPALTTIRQNVPLAGQLLAQHLLQYFQDGLPTQTILPVTLIHRESA
jgi:DNA-binding LacI/PurR family transcriptional regulator